MSMLQTKNQTQTFKEENMSDLMFVYGTLVSNVMRQAVLNHPVEAQKDSLRNYVKPPTRTLMFIQLLKKNRVELLMVLFFLLIGKIKPVLTDMKPNTIKK